MSKPPKLETALQHADASSRLQAALTAGTHPQPDYVVPLVNRCAIEPDFYVREMLTWALTRLPRDTVLPHILNELKSSRTQARAQALHTLSKLADTRGAAAVTPAHLHDPDDEVARTAWRTAVGLVPDERRSELARELAQEFGRGSFDTHRSLARAISELGEEGREVALAGSLANDASVRAHAEATLRVIDDPESTFYLD